MPSPRARGLFNVEANESCRLHVVSKGRSGAIGFIMSKRRDANVLGSPKKKGPEEKECRTCLPYRMTISSVVTLARGRQGSPGHTSSLERLTRKSDMTT